MNANIDAAQDALRTAIAKYGENHPEIANRWDRVASELKIAGHLTEAKQAYQRALTILISHDGDISAYILTLANTVDHLGGIYLSEGETRLAKTLYEEAISIFNMYEGPDSPRLARAKTKLNEITPHA